MDVLKTSGYPQDPRIHPFPQTSPRATDVPSTSKQSQAPEMSPGPSDPPIPGRFH